MIGIDSTQQKVLTKIIKRIQNYECNLESYKVRTLTTGRNYNFPIIISRKLCIDQ